MSDEAIPFLDLISIHQDIKSRLLTVLDKAIDAGHFIGGHAVESFEHDFAAYVGTKFCIGVNSGTDALRFILIAGGVKPGSAVITVPNTFIATTEAITQAGAVPLFVDVNPQTYNMDPIALQKFLDEECKIDPETHLPVHINSGCPISAIVPVHLYGQPADMDALQLIAEKNHLKIFEDACQAHGSQYYSEQQQKWCNAGSMSLAGAFSFYPGKNLGALGEAGAVVTDDETIAQTVMHLREHGSKIKYFHELEGYNGRLDAIQAGFLSIKLPLLDSWNAKRLECAWRYTILLEGVKGITTPFVPTWAKQNFHLYVIRTRHREEIQAHLALCEISTGIHYPVPLHLQKAYLHLGYKIGAFPVAEAAAHEIVSLPMFPGLTEAQQVRIVKEIKSLVK